MLDPRFDQITAPPNSHGDPYPGHEPNLSPSMQPPLPHEPPPRTWQPYYPDELQQARAKYLRDWRIVKAARFNAAKRLERKQAASLLAFALAGTAGFVVPFFTLMFADKLVPHTKNVLDFACYVSGALSLSIGLVEQAKNHPAMSQRFHKCGLAVNSVLRRLRNAPYPDESLLDELTRAYEQALSDCDHNHDEIDQTIAFTKDALDAARHFATVNPRSLAEDHLRTLEKRMRLLRLQELAHIYWLYTAVWLGPAVLGFIVWLSLSPAAP